MSRLAVPAIFALFALAAGISLAHDVAAATASTDARSVAIAAHSPLRLAVICAFGFFVVVRAPARRKERRPLALVACALALGGAGALRGPGEDAATALLLAGEAVTLVFAAWLLVSALALGRCFGILPEVRGLVTRGPYRVVRHPVYLGELGAFGGLVLAAPSRWNGVAACALCAGQWLRMRLEENALRAEFPEYEDYASRTPRLFPRTPFLVKRAAGANSLRRSSPHRPRSARAARGATLVIVLAATLLLIQPAGAALSRPALVGPAAGSTFTTLPTFSWRPVGKAAKYEFQLAADQRFTAPVLGTGYDRFTTRNLRATILKTVPNGTYWWRVRALSAGGRVSRWARPRSFQKLWDQAPELLSPDDGASVVYPASPLKLHWAPVPHAKTYLVRIATDPQLASLVAGIPVETAATTFTPTGLLTPGQQYFWAVTPLDAAGNRGRTSQVHSFVRDWSSTTTTTLQDLLAIPEVVDPQFGWDPVPGAVRYQVEVWSSNQPDLKVCCSGSSIGADLSPPVVFPDNEYYWRMRAFDAAGNAGAWTGGPSFTKTYDMELPSVQGLRMRDNLADPGTDASEDPGYQTAVPIVSWDPVPNASSYDVEVTPFLSGHCDWSPTLRTDFWKVRTATNAWTPLGSAWNGRVPFSSWSMLAVDTGKRLQPDVSYCVRVRPRDGASTNAAPTVTGDYTQLGGDDQPAFTWTGLPAATSPGCNGGYLCSDDYRGPVGGGTVSGMPLFTWRPLTGKGSYFVLVARDPQFHTIVDYALTEIPAYAPRTAFSPTTYEDEDTQYYWVVLPATSSDGGGSLGSPSLAAAAAFQKHSMQPAPLSPALPAAPGDFFGGSTTFRWTLADAARRYRLQVAQDPTFGTVLDEVVTDSTSYTSVTAYPSDKTVYWRVRGEDENFRPFRWSPVRSFARKLGEPAIGENLTAGALLPTWTWEPVAGAASYDLDVDFPDGQHRSFYGIQSTAWTPVLMWGTGLWKWRVRANFPKLPFGVAPGGWTDGPTFARKVPPPASPRQDVGRRYVVLRWKPAGGGNGVKEYRVQISARPDFSITVETASTQNTRLAPLLTQYPYLSGGRFYWRVASVDAGGNVGGYSSVRSFLVRRS
jgi:protein-S-isoprenylcysteine O-methyltransferase Ste14